ncbi:MAG: chemotaxis protein [Nitrospirae bacterium]|jgi:two-component system chemotaxis response regulator CheV|nr:chemotaxis protein [Nitrospirota bacterium]
MSQLDNLILQVGTNQMELVDFRMYQEEDGGNIREGIYGINVSKVIEIIRMPPSLTPVPDSNPYQAGIINLRGQVIPVINLAKWMKIKEPDCIEQKNKQIVVTEFSSVRLGFVVHKASQIRRISWKEIVPITMATSGRHTGSKVTGTVKLSDDEVLLILDFESIVEEMGIFGRQEETLERMTERKIREARYILAADDSPVALSMLTKALQKGGFSVMGVKNGQEAIEKLRAQRDLDPGKDVMNRVALLITDVEMPVMDGYTLTKEVKADPTLRALPILMHSSMSGKENVRKGKEAGADDYIVKFDPEGFVAIVEKILEKNSLPMEALTGSPSLNPIASGKE